MIRRSNRIASRPYETRYNKDGSASRIPICVPDEVGYLVDEYNQRINAVAKSTRSSEWTKAVFRLFRFAAANPLPMVYLPHIRYTMLIMLEVSLAQSHHPMITTIAERFLDACGSMRAHRHYRIA
jgi:hypothetical protein